MAIESAPPETAIPSLQFSDKTTPELQRDSFIFISNCSINSKTKPM